MRAKSKIVIAVLAVVTVGATFVGVSARSSVDWDGMTVKQKVAWTANHIRETCPNGLGVDHTGQDDDIDGIPQIMVIGYIKANCKK